MKIEEIHERINSFSRPEGYDEAAWAALRGKALAIWIDYLDDHPWDTPLDVTCMEFYLMLLDENKELIIADKDLIRWVNNEFNQRWVAKYLKSGVKFLKQKNYEKALKFFQAVVQMQSTSYQGWFYCAFTKQRLLRYKEALADYNLAIALEPQNEHGYINRSKLFSLLDMDEEAMSDLDTVIRLNPKSVLAYLHRAQFRKLAGDDLGSQQDFEMAYRLDPLETRKYKKRRMPVRAAS